MTPVDVRKRIKVIYSLISQDDYLSALRISYETLLGIASYETGMKGSNFENLNRFEVLKLLFAFLSGRGFKDINYMFEDLCILSIYYENQNRHSNPEDIKPRVGVLLSKVLGIIECNLLERRDGLYSVDNFENSLINYENLFNDDISKLKARVLIYYYYIETRYFEYFEKSYWDEALSESNYIADEVVDSLVLMSLKIEDAIVSNDYDVLVELSDLIDKYEVSEVLEDHIIRDYNITKVISELNDFKRKEMVVGKNVYKDGGWEKEASFHKHLHTFLAKGKSNDEIIMSEIPLERNRFDIFWNNLRTKLSVIIELKVNNMTNLITDIQQIERYLDADSDVIFYKQPDFGVLFVYRIGKKAPDDIFAILDESDYEYQVVNNSIVIYRNGKPVIIEVIYSAFED